MIRITPALPFNYQVTGQLYWDADLSVLGEDMVDVLIPTTGVLISAGWYPEGSLTGRYVVSATSGFDELRREETFNVYEAKALVEELARQFDRPAWFVSESQSVVHLSPIVKPFAVCA